MLFDGEHKTKEINRLEEKVNDILKNQGSINSKKSELVKLKKQLMKGIVNNMENSGDKRVQMKMAKSRELINDINDCSLFLYLINDKFDNEMV